MRYNYELNDKGIGIYIGSINTMEEGVDLKQLPKIHIFVGEKAS